jgi:dipeptidyl aminopeptidase/acylaminoacyl peptidase
MMKERTIRNNLSQPISFRGLLGVLCLLLLSLTISACSAAAEQTSTTAPIAAVVPSATPQPTATLTSTPQPTLSATQTPPPPPTATASATPKPPNPLSIEAMRQRAYPGSDITVEQTLAPGSNYQRYYVSYQSDGLKIYALLTVPSGPKPASGWPVVIFNHGFIPPTLYRTTERYIAYVDAFARSGYIVLRSDYRGHDKSEGVASGGYGSPDYTVDVLNGLSSVKRYKDADPNRIGMWGHSMGGQITLRSIVTVKDIKAAVIWSGVVASYADLLAHWNTRGGAPPVSGESRSWRQRLVNENGTPEANPEFWNSISPNSYLAEGVPPVQIHHDVNDSEVPASFSEGLARELKDAGQTYEYYTYPGDDHNISLSFNIAMARSIAFFDRYVKGH